MQMNMDDEEQVEVAQYLSSAMVDLDLLTNSDHSTSGSIPPLFSCRPEISSHVLMAPLQFPEVSSLVLAGGVVSLPYENDLYTAGGMSSTSAFRRYMRHLGPQRRLSKPACGQRMFKTAMRYSHHHHQQQQQQQQASGNQLHHIISERKRREKLNDSFRALKTVLPPCPKNLGQTSKLGQTSILITAREYVNYLKSKVRELEEKNRALQSELARHAEEDEKVEIQITRAEGNQTGEVCTIKIAATPARGNTTDVVIRILQRLKDQMGEGVTLVSMSTGEDGPHRASQLKLHLKSTPGTMWEEKAVWEAVTKAMARRC